MAAGTFLPPSKYTLNDIFNQYKTNENYQQIILSSVDQTINDISAGKLTNSSTTLGNIEYYRSSINQIKLPVLEMGEHQLVVIKCQFFDPNPNMQQYKNPIGSGGHKKIYIVLLVSTDPTKRGKNASIFCWGKSIPQSIRQQTNFEREIAIQKNLPDDICVKLLGDCHFDGKNNNMRIGTLMEYIPSNLFLKINDGTIRNLSKEQIGNLFRNLLVILFNLNIQNIRHGDIKLENILADDEMNVKLCDFGYALLLTESKEFFYPRGSELYSSPEDISEFKVHYDTKSDMWAMGIVFFMICYGGHFVKDSLVPLCKDWEKLEKTINNALATCIPGSHAGPFIPLIRNMLTVDPEWRPSAKIGIDVLNQIVKSFTSSEQNR